MTNMGEQMSHGVIRIAMIKESIVPMLRMEQALKGKISPTKNDNEELTILFKDGVRGNKQEATENIARWARRLKIDKSMKWIGKPKEKKEEKAKV